MSIRKFSESMIPSLPVRLAEGRPVMTKSQTLALAKRVLAMTTSDDAGVDIVHSARVITRMANDQVLSGDDGDDLTIRVRTAFGERYMSIAINQLDETTLRTMVQRCESLAQQQVGRTEQVLPTPVPTQDSFPATHLWHDETIRAMNTTRGTVIPDLLSAVASKRLRAAGFLGLIARVHAVVSKDGLEACSEETDAELTVTARGQDGKSSGWGGAAARNWEKVRPGAVAEHAIETALRSADPVAIEPGRRTAILGPNAVVQIIRYLAPQFDAADTDRGATSFSRQPSGNRRGQRFFDPRIHMRSDPADPDGGYPPYFAGGYVSPAMDWIVDGVLRNLSYDVRYGMGRGKQYAQLPYSIRVSGGTTPINEMIAQCREGIYVNRFSGVELLDARTCLVSGVTRDGCFLIKDGKIAKAAKNFRFLESPFFFLNRIEALGVPERAAFGFTPPARLELNSPTEWPRPPIIVPAMMVRDFNFSSLSDAI